MQMSPSPLPNFNANNDSNCGAEGLSAFNVANTQDYCENLLLDLATTHSPSWSLPTPTNTSNQSKTNLTCGFR